MQKKRRVAFICLGNQVTTMAQTRMNACGFHQSAIHESQIQPRFGTNTDTIAVVVVFPRPGNGDAVAKRISSASISARRITGIRVMRRDNFRYPRKLRWKRRPRWHHAILFRTMVKENRRPKARCNCWVTDSALNRNH